LIRKVSTMLAAAGSAAFLVGSMGLTGSASAASLPSCLVTGSHCTNVNGTPIAGSLGQNGGVAGYYGADDNHTHYRYVQTTVNASPQLIDLSGAVATDLGALPSVGDQLCDPNDGVTAQISLGYVPADNQYEVRYIVGKYPANADPCTQNNFQTSGAIFRSGNLLFAKSVGSGISPGDSVFLAIYYTPSGNHRHQLSFGACDITSGICRQAYTSQRALEFWEFGVGAFTPGSVLTAPAENKFENFSSTNVTCYSCSGSVPISSVSPVNPFGAGGLYEAQFVNSSSQTVMSPNDTLSGASFNIYNGSTSI
jgi:hypothetical protein